MSIAPLPPSTTHLLTSTQTLLSPLSAIKELIDNSLDAASSSINIEISSNTLDTIQIRDNGHGIAPEDRKLVGGRGCTSKIKNEGDLRTVGGRTVGFRGEAIGALGRVCEGVSVVTRVEGEIMGRKWRLGGWSEGCEEPVSHPIGTTFRATDFFKNIPVRRQEAIKNATKCLGQIKQMLQAYALARPIVRFSLKVLKAKNYKLNWTYAPSKPGAGIEEAAWKVVGKSCASECQYHSLEEEGYAISAFLPKPGADGNKVSGIGQYLSVDERPMSCDRGSLKKIKTIYKERLRATGIEGCKDPFLWLDIRCPQGAYDINVEPLKNDVLFDDEELMLGIVESLLKKALPEKTAEHEEVALEPTDTTLSARDERQRTRTRSRRSPSAAIPVHEDKEESPEPPRKRQRTWQTNMYGMYDEEEALMLVDENAPPRDFEEEDKDTEEALRSVNVSNPWVMAKMNAPIKPRGAHRSDFQPVTPLRERDRNEVDSSALSNTLPAQQRPGLMTPASSSPFPRRYEEHSDAMGRAKRQSPLIPSAFDQIPHLHPTRQHDRSESEETEERSAFPGFTSARNIPQGTPLDAIPEAPRRRPQAQRNSGQKPGSSNKPFKTPKRMDPHDTWFDHLQNQPSQQSSKTRRQQESNTGSQWSPINERSRPSPAFSRPRRTQIHDAADALIDSFGERQARDRDIRDFARIQDAPEAPSREEMSRRFNNLPSPDPALNPLRPRSGRSRARPSESRDDGSTMLLEPNGDIPSLHKQLEHAASKIIPGEQVQQAQLQHQHQPVQDRLHDPGPEQESPPKAVATRSKSRTHSRHRTRTKFHTAQLPLERIPKGASTKPLLLQINTTPTALSSNMKTLDGATTNAIPWDVDVDLAYSGFVDGVGGIPISKGEIAMLGVKLEDILKKSEIVVDGEMGSNMVSGVVKNGLERCLKRAQVDNDEEEDDDEMESRI